jgi:hypothetical protein
MINGLREREREREDDHFSAFVIGVFGSIQMLYRMFYAIRLGISIRVLFSFLVFPSFLIV